MAAKRVFSVPLVSRGRKLNKKYDIKLYINLKETIGKEKRSKVYWRKKRKKVLFIMGD